MLKKNFKEILKLLYSFTLIFSIIPIWILISQIEKDSKNAIFWLCITIGFMLMLFIPAFILVIRSINSKLNAVEQNAQVEVVRKSHIITRRGASILCRICFKFTDDTEKEFDVESKTYATIQEHERGMLFYKMYRSQFLDKKYALIFIRFEKQ